MQYITPTHDELIKFSSNVKCMIAGCSRRIATTTALRFHLIFGHGLSENDPTVIQNCPRPIGTCQYYCPVAKCKYSSTSGKSMPSLNRAKYHYISTHLEKIHPCPKCKSKFTTEKKMKYHMRDCGIQFVCSCNIAYSGRQGLMQHFRRSKHQVPERFLYLFKQRKKLERKKTTKTKILPKGGMNLTNTSKAILLQPVNVPSIKLMQFAPLPIITTSVRPSFSMTPLNNTKEMSVQTDQTNATVSESIPFNTQTLPQNSIQTTQIVPIIRNCDTSCQTMDWMPTGQHTVNNVPSLMPPPLRPISKSAKHLQPKIIYASTLACPKCKAGFPTERRLRNHVRDCGIKFVCSCGIAYAGRLGLILHIKRSKHKIPEKFQYLFEKAKKLPEVVPTKQRKIILPKSRIFSNQQKQPVLVPQVLRSMINSVRQCTTPNTSFSSPRTMTTSTSPVSNPIQGDNLNTTEMSVQTDQNSVGGSNTQNNQTMLDELVRELENATNVLPVSQDTSCQTLDWMTDNGNKEMNNNPLGIWESRGMQTDNFGAYEELFMPSMATQTSDFDFMNYEFSSSMTQTDHSGELLELLTNTNEKLPDPLNNNNNSNSMMDCSSHIQTQTCNNDGISTQTQTFSNTSIYDSVGGEYLDLFNNNATQTDFFTSSSSSQTTHCDKFLTDFLNIETQTESSCFSTF